MQCSLNENIKKLRLQNGLNQVEFAKIMNVSKQCVSNWENENVMPSIDMLVRIANYFNVTTDALLGRSPQCSIVVDELSAEQTAHIRLIVSDLKQLNKNKKE